VLFITLKRKGDEREKRKAVKTRLPAGGPSRKGQLMKTAESRGNRKRQEKKWKNCKHRESFGSVYTKKEGEKKGPQNSPEMNSEGVAPNEETEKKTNERPRGLAKQKCGKKANLGAGCNNSREKNLLVQRGDLKQLGEGAVVSEPSRG